jgi:hypothetical protein
MTRSTQHELTFSEQMRKNHCGGVGGCNRRTSVSWNKVPHEGDDQGSMLRGILYKESSGRNAISFEVYRYRCIQIAGGRVRF